MAGDAQDHAERGTGRLAQRQRGVAGDAAEERSSARAAEAPSSEPGRGRSAASPKRARSSGWRGALSGPSASANSARQCATNGSMSACQAGPSEPSCRAIAEVERSSRTADPSSSGCAAAAGGTIHSRPWFASGSRLKKGEPGRVGGPPSRRRGGSPGGSEGWCARRRRARRRPHARGRAVPRMRGRSPRPSHRPAPTTTASYSARFTCVAGRGALERDLSPSRRDCNKCWRLNLAQTLRSIAFLRRAKNGRLRPR